MANVGAFDPELRVEALFDPVLISAGWFDPEMIDDGASSSSSLTPVLAALLLAGTSPARVGGTVVVPLTP